MTPAAPVQQPQPGVRGHATGNGLVQPRALDAEYEWLGYDTGHPMTWIPSDWPVGPLLRSG